MEKKEMVINRMVAPTGPRRAPAQVNAMTPKDIYGILRRHVFLIVFMTFIGLMMGGTSWFLLRRYLPKYTAKTFLRVLSPTTQDPFEIGRAMDPKDIQYGFRSSIASLITTQSSLQKLTESKKIQGMDWFKRFGDIKDEREKRLRKAFKDLKKNFSAYPDRDREFISVAMTCGDPKEAAGIVNEMVRLFLVSRTLEEKKDITEKLSVLTNQRDGLLLGLKTAEDGLVDIQKRFKIPGLQDPRDQRYEHTITRKLNALEIQQDAMMLQVGGMQAAIAQYEQWVQGPVPVQVDRLVESDPLAVSINQRLVVLESALDGSLTKFGRNHRQVKEAEESISRLKEELAERKILIADYTRQSQLKNAQDQLVVMRKQLEILQERREEAETQQVDLDMALQLYTQGLEVRDERKERLNEVKEQIESYRMIHEDPKTAKVESVGRAPRPLEMSSPRWQLYFPGGMVLGLMLGIGLTFMIELLNDLVRLPRDVHRYLHIPLLGIIPDAIEDNQADGIDLCNVVRQAPYSVISEAYRRLRTNLRLSTSGHAQKVLLVTSGMAGEGKTPVAVNLATTLLAENKKVLLIDANFRRPNLNKIFPQEEAQSGSSEFGLSALLMGLCSFDDARKSEVMQGLDIIESGPLPSNPAELLGSYQMEQLINDRRKSYDYIIIDSPPVLLVSDVKVLSRFVDGSILVFNAGMTRRGTALRTIRELKEVDTVVTGCVLFAVRSLKGGYFRKQFKLYRQYQGVQLAHSV
jgi:succinoglycan biosynthesis transport protein ExoP